MGRIFRFIYEMDAKAWRTVFVSFVLFGGVGVVFLFGAQVLGFNQGTQGEGVGAAENGSHVGLLYQYLGQAGSGPGRLALPRCLCRHWRVGAGGGIAQRDPGSHG